MERKQTVIEGTVLRDAFYNLGRLAYSFPLLGKRPPSTGKHILSKTTEEIKETPFYMKS